VYAGCAPIPTFQGGTWNVEQTVSAVHLSCSIVCESTADIRIAVYVSPPPSTATPPDLSLPNRAFQRSLISSDFSRVMACGLTRMPLGFEPLAKKAELFSWICSPMFAAAPHAKIGDVPTSGWYRQFMRSWMISDAGTASLSASRPARLSTRSS
jgi:hypothetical protein